MYDYMIAYKFLKQTCHVTEKPRFTGPVWGKELGPVNRETRYIGVRFTLIYT